MVKYASDHQNNHSIVFLGPKYIEIHVLNIILVFILPEIWSTLLSVRPTPEIPTNKLFQMMISRKPIAMEL